MIAPGEQQQQLAAPFVAAPPAARFRAARRAAVCTRAQCPSRVSPRMSSRPPPPPSDHSDGGSDSRPAARAAWGPLELMWRLQTQRGEPPTECRVCRGHGETECPMCHATGVLTLGDSLVCSIEGGTQCLVCRDGYITCDNCKGAGKVAAWLQSAEGEFIL